MSKKAYQNNYLKNTMALLLGTASFSLLAADINSVTSGRNANGEYEVQIGGSGFSQVRSYSLTNPARIVIDIPNAKSHLTNNITQVSNPAVSSVAVIEGDDRVRATVNLSKSVPYEVVEKNNKITVVVRGSKSHGGQNRSNSVVATGGVGVDFKRGGDGQGKVQINLPKGVSVDMQRRGNKVVANLKGGSFPQTKRLNVTDFGTPVKAIDVFRNSLSISMVSDNFEVVSYQSDDIFSIEFSKPTQQQQDQSQLLPGDSKKTYSGEPLSLNFQDIEVRAVLQLIGDFTNTNIVVSDAVQGSITLRLNNVPWDQALDVILQTKGLTKQRNSDVIFVAPSKDIAASKRDAYEVANVEKEVAPLQQQLIQVQYARAEDLEKIIEDNSEGKNSGDDKINADGLLSSRGKVSIDSRTNTLIINDVPTSIEKVRRLVSQLDVAVAQVLIDARVVTASNNFTHELGARFGGAFTGATDNVAFGGAGDATGASAITSSANSNIASTGQAFPTSVPDLSNRLGVNLASTRENASSFGLSILGSDFLIDLELSAMQDEGRAEIISSPRVIAQDGGEATIEQSVEYPRSVTGADGVVTTEWKQIPLELNVSPKIAPNNQVDMELEVSKDTLGAIYNGEQTVNTSSVKTQVLVDSGETVVLGGVYEQNKSKSVSKVPVLGDLPIVGRAFRKDTNIITKNELLIFVTPKIIDKRYTGRDKFIELRN